MGISPYVVALGGSIAVAVGIAVPTWRRRAEPGTTALGVLLLAVIAWSGSYAVALGTAEYALRLTLQRLILGVASVVPVSWFVFTLQYTGYGDRVSRRTVAVLATPAAAVTALVWIEPLEHLVWSSSSVRIVDGVALVVQTFGPAFWLSLLYGYALVLAGLVLLLGLVVTTDHLFADQAFAMLAGVLVALVANLVSVLGQAPLSGLDLTPYAFAISALAFGYAFGHSRLLDLVPATRRIGHSAVVRNMRDGVVVLDDERRVVDVNPVARRQFDCDPGAVVGAPVDTLVDEPTFDVPAHDETVVWSTPGPRAFQITASRLTDRHDRTVGRVLVVRDVTDRRNRRQQLQVLNRVLRHNLRNDMNVIEARATQLADRLSGEPAELAERIQLVADDLAETGTKAREIERIMSRRDADPQPVDLSSVVARLADAVRDAHPQVEVETDLPPTVEIRSTGVLESVVENVLENAVVHNDRDDPQLRVTVEQVAGGDAVEISVADNGPGIPAQERSVLVEGTETPLEHGSGLGLWLVNWGVMMLGGDVTFEDNEPRGSVVTIRVPRCQPDVLAGSEDGPPLDPG